MTKNNKILLPRHQSTNILKINFYNRDGSQKVYFYRGLLIYIMKTLILTDKGKPIEKLGRKVTGLMYRTYYDGWTAWNTSKYFRRGTY